VKLQGTGEPSLRSAFYNANRPAKPESVRHSRVRRTGLRWRGSQPLRLILPRAYDLVTNYAFSPIPEILDELKLGKPIVLVDDEDRENEGDIVYAAEKITPQAINFMMLHGRGLICLALTAERCEALQLHPQTQTNTAQLGTAFTVTIDAHPKFGVTTGVSARDQAATVQAAVADDAKPQDLLRPGHTHPLRAREGGVLVRAGQTEGSVDLARLAGLKPAGVICEILREDGEAMRRPELEIFCEKHGLKMCTIAELISFRLRREQFVKRVESVTLPTRWGSSACTRTCPASIPSRTWRFARAASASSTKRVTSSYRPSRSWFAFTANA